ncbi:MAG TPA: YCF48-related protein, partial [Nitrospiraceae bacterium]
MSGSWWVSSLSRGECLVVVVLATLLYATPSWTADSPLTITPQVSHTEAILMGLYFHTPQLGWAAGSGGTILKTVDGGKRWKKVVSGTTASLSGVFFFDEKQGWAVGANGTIRRSL